MSIYQHYRRSEYPFIDQVLDWKERTADEYSPRLTDFLDPRQQKIAENITGKHGEVRVSFHGAAAGAERKRAFFYPDYYEPEMEDFQLAAYRIDYPVKFVRLEHPQILGALTSSGLVRGKFGDITDLDGAFQLVTAEETAAYLEQQLTHIGKAGVTLEKLDLHNLQEPKIRSVERMVTVSSLRLDTVLAEAFSLSRAKIKPLIEQGAVKVNWMAADNPAMMLEEGDMLSLRKKGRCRLSTVEGETKKGRLRLMLSHITG
ncbi:RNA-binding protein [Alkalicoccus chagannorensis]|uniref:YlmH family RNA-binding protein n=1 Tax=Alkalicoccus chagannorensis TaxID=427072 RepID=UPI000417D537|nr:RNA-binding protein [Alkalicoccus chagannorensis]